MEFVIRNKARKVNKYIRFAKWKLKRLPSKFGVFSQAEIFISREGSIMPQYRAIIKLDVSGPDLIISSRSKNLDQLWSQLPYRLKRQLRTHTSRKLDLRRKS